MGENRARLPRYHRVPNPPSLRLTARDRHILEAIHSFDGMLGFSQIRRLFFSGKSQAELRLRLLYHHRYLNRPNRKQRLRLPEMIYWLDKIGAELVAGLNNTPLMEFRWRRKPRWFLVDHDLAVNDFRLDLIDACRRQPEVTLEEWVPENEFWASPDRVQYTHNRKSLSRYVRPDGFFVLTTRSERIRHLLEIDRSTEDNPRFLREKVLPGMAYLASSAYERRFGHRSGRWLVVTTGKRRMHNMLRQAKRGGAGYLFLFTTYGQVSPDTILLEPIWLSETSSDPLPLVTLH